MQVLEAGQVGRLLRDLELTAAVAMRRAAPQAELHVWLLMRLRKTDARTDAEFQQRLCRHIGMRGKLRARKQALFELLETFKRNEPPRFEDVLMRVSELTGQIEKSVASQLLALLDPEQPAIDRDLRELLPRYGFIPLAEAPMFDECVSYHRRLRDLFEQVIAAPGWSGVCARFDAALGPVETVLTDVRKLNLHLSHSRRVVALMPTLEVVRRPASAARAPGITTSEPAPRVVRPSVRLHLCR